MRATLEFELPEDRTEYMCAVKSLDLALVLWDHLEWIRQQLRSDILENFSQPYEICAKSLRDSLEERGIVLEDLLP